MFFPSLWGRFGYTLLVPIPVSRLLRLSRPRFWIYVFGPYLVGLAAGAFRLSDLSSWRVLVFGCFFLLPANLLIYGVNDIHDYETDRRNAKKEEYETLVPPSERKPLQGAILVLTLPFLLLVPFAAPFGAQAAMAGFLFFSLFYSAPPIRAKARPILDSAFNVLYILPGVFAYALVGGARLSPALIAAAWLWAMAMHAYSALPDIRADRQSGLQTVATLLGFRGTLGFCLTLYSLAAVLAFSRLSLVAVLLGAVYVVLMVVSWRTGDEEGRLLRVYRWFPLTNTLCGMALFFAVALSKFF